MPCHGVLSGKGLATDVAAMLVVRMRGSMPREIILALKHLVAAFELARIHIDRAVGRSANCCALAI